MSTCLPHTASDSHACDDFQSLRQHELDHASGENPRIPMVFRAPLSYIAPSEIVFEVGERQEIVGHVVRGGDHKV